MPVGSAPIARPPQPIVLRPALCNDSRRIAELVRIAADGVADYIWGQLAAPGEDLLAIGERRYAGDGVGFSHRNAVLAQQGDTVVGMMLAFAMPPRADGPPEREVDPVLRPYAELEVPGSLYIASIAVEEGHRRAGIATRLLASARRRARAEALYGMSAIIFAANTPSRRLFQRHGFAVVDRRPVVPHPLIRHTGEALLYHAHP
ncbi:N-acetyltransferase family protein [Azospirillum largimobile]